MRSLPLARCSFECSREEQPHEHHKGVDQGIGRELASEENRDKRQRRLPCVGCVCYNAGEPQGAVTPHGSRIASAVWSYFGGSPSLRIGSRSSITATNCTVLAASSRIATAIRTKSVMVSTTLPFRPALGDRSGKRCGTAPPPLFVAYILLPQPCTATVRKTHAKPQEPCTVPMRHSYEPCRSLARTLQKPPSFSLACSLEKSYWLC